MLTRSPQDALRYSLRFQWRSALKRGRGGGPRCRSKHANAARGVLEETESDAEANGWGVWIWGESYRRDEVAGGL